MKAKPIIACRFQNGEFFVDTADRKNIKVPFPNGGKKFILLIACGHTAINNHGHVSII